MLLHCRLVAMLCVFTCHGVSSQSVLSDSLPKNGAPSNSSADTPSKWYEKIGLRGYAQFRYNRLLETNPDLKCEQCDKSIGRGQTFAFRRSRLILSGDVHKQFFIYIQFDYSADASSSSKHYLQVRDAYFDYAFDQKKEYRIRFGQSKVPYGFENLQSSSNRLPLDRSDALNSAAANERDFGMFFYYAPAKIRTLIRNVSNEALKGSNDYGVFAIGLHNGQTANKPEQNDNLHVVARLSYPFTFRSQIIEPGIQAYSGKFTLPKDQVSAGTKVAKDNTYLDRRVAGSIVLYPQPFGLLAEYNIGEGPAFDAETDSIHVKKLHGGFITASYRSPFGKGFIMPYTRYQVYDGAKKHELDARSYQLNELEMGVEWQPIKNLELTLAYVISNRKYADFRTDYHERGNLLRIQLQANY